MAQCINPFMLTEGENQIPCPCGKCLPCLKRRVSGWSFRLMQHGKTQVSAHFITLTYSTEHVPISNNGYMSLSPTRYKINRKGKEVNLGNDVTLFIKRLRKVSRRKISYYYCGEYGGKTMRPHYHMLVFNAEIADIEKSWQLGAVHYGEVTGASIGYTLKYMVKPGKIPMHKNDDRIPEFANMSKGLGLNYLTAAMRQWHMADIVNRTYLTLEDGVKCSMPRYYKEKLYSKADKALIQEFHEANEKPNPVLLMSHESRLDLINMLKAKVNKLAAERKTI